MAVYDKNGIRAFITHQRLHVLLGSRYPSMHTMNTLTNLEYVIVQVKYKGHLVVRLMYILFYQYGNMSLLGIGDVDLGW